MISVASSGSFNTSAYNNRYLTLSWETTSQSIENNTSTIKWTLKGAGSASGYYISGNFKVVINGTTVYSSSTRIELWNGTTVASGTTTISHNADGTKSFTASAEAGIYYVAVNCTGSGSFTLDTIPRATTPTLSTSTFDMGTSITISTPRASSSFTHTLSYTFGNLSGSIGTGIGTSKTWTVPLTLANAIPNAISGVGSITCQTYNGSTLIGTKSVTFTASVPSTVIPTISAVSIKEAVDGIADKFSGFVQNRSMLNVTITATGVYGSTISKYETYIQSVSYLGSSFTSNLITASGSIGVLTIITDSRGRTSQATNSVTILEYASPTISTFSAFRCDSSGNADDEGTRINVAVNFNISTVNNLNDKYYEILYKVKGATSWEGTLASGNVYSRNDNFVTSSLFNVDNAYEVTIRIWDYFISSENGINAMINIPTAFTLFDCRNTGKGIAFGKVSAKDAMEVALDLDLTGELIQEDRQTPTLLNSWVNYGAGYESASYWKDKCNVVHLGGLVKSGTIVDGTVIFTLPEGYRPRASEKFITVSLNAICVIDIYASGNVTIRAGANAGWLSLSGICFRAS